MDQKLRYIPEGMHTITPHLVCGGASEAIAWYTKVFGAKEAARLPGPDGKLAHALVMIGDSALMLVDEMPEWGLHSPLSLKGSPVTIHQYVADADAVFQRAIDNGATSLMAVSDTFWGDRYGVLQDPFGHKWSVGTHVRDVSMEEMQQAMQAQSMGGKA